MKLSLKWLKDYVALPASVDELAKRLTMAGLEIEGISRPGDGLKGVVVWALEDNANAVAFYAGAGGRDIAEGVEIFEHKALKKVAFVWE